MAGIRPVVSVMFLMVLSTCGNLDSALSAVQIAWADYKKTFNKSYSEQEEAERFGFFEKNFNFIMEDNAKNQDFTLTINVFADRSPEELGDDFRNVSGRDVSHRTYQDDREGTTSPPSWDWTALGAVTPVGENNQGQCGSCWAFAAVGALEGALKIAGGTLIPLSEQQFLDCSRMNSGCSGGLPAFAYDYADSIKGVCTEESYPYAAADSSCKLASSSCTKVSMGITYMSIGEEHLKDSLVKSGPVSGAVDADVREFRFYDKGIVNGCGGSVDHAILVVGYGTDGGKDYWKLKNSWGPFWGERGYARVSTTSKCLYGLDTVTVHVGPDGPVLTDWTDPPAWRKEINEEKHDCAKTTLDDCLSYLIDGPGATNKECKATSFMSEFYPSGCYGYSSGKYEGCFFFGIGDDIPLSNPSIQFYPDECRARV